MKRLDIPNVGDLCLQIGKECCQHLEDCHCQCQAIDCKLCQYPQCNFQMQTDLGGCCLQGWAYLLQKHQLFHEQWGKESQKLILVFALLHNLHISPSTVHKSIKLVMTELDRLVGAFLMGHSFTSHCNQAIKMISLQVIGVGLLLLFQLMKVVETSRALYTLPKIELLLCHDWMDDGWTTIEKVLFLWRWMARLAKINFYEDIKCTKLANDESKNKYQSNTTCALTLSFVLFILGPMQTTDTFDGAHHPRTHQRTVLQSSADIICFTWIQLVLETKWYIIINLLLKNSIILHHRSHLINIMKRAHR